VDIAKELAKDFGAELSIVDSSFEAIETDKSGPGP
jgi:polar amino acid transport system substrate-binding protein